MKLETTVQLTMSMEDYSSLRRDLDKILSDLGAHQMADRTEILNKFPGIANLLDIMYYNRLDESYMTREQVDNPNIDDPVDMAGGM